jgi:amidase
MPDNQFTYMTASGLAAAMSAGKVSSLELTQNAIARIEHFDPQINAVCVRDFDHAIEAARAADIARAKGNASPLLGIPMTIKESFNIAGMPTTWGMPAGKNYIAKEDALPVSRLKAAGAVILGKTNVPFALGDLQSYNDIYGTTNNPWNPGRTPGGSSGGSAAALAAGYGALSLGSDIGGSLRAPAHYCGVYAHKPTFGLLPSRGHTPPNVPPLAIERDLTTIGPMARSAADLSLVMGVLAVPDEQMQGIAYRVALPPSRHEDLSGFRVLMLDSHPLMETASSVRSAIDQLAQRLSNAGAKVARTSPLLPDPVTSARLYVRLLFSFLASNWPIEMYQHVVGLAAKLDPADLSLAAERTRGMVLSHRDWVMADNARARLRQQWRALFAEFDVVICPVMPTPAFPHDHSPNQMERRLDIDGTPHSYSDQLVWSGIATAPGLPATAMPIGLSSDGLPIGVQVIGPMFEDLTTIRFAELVEREFGGFVAPPLS